MLQHGGLPGEARVGEVLDLVRRSFPAAWPLEDLVVTAGIEAARPPGRRAVRRPATAVPLALALAGALPLLLLDEPTSAMDVEGRAGLLDDDARLADRGHTVVARAPSLDEADAVADRVVVIADGRVADGSAADAGPGRRPAPSPSRRRPSAGWTAPPAVSGVTRQGGTVTLATTDAAVTLRALLDGGPRPRGSRAPASRTPSSPSSRRAGTPPGRSRAMTPLLAFQLRRIGRNRQYLFHGAAAGAVHRLLHRDLRRAGHRPGRVSA